MLSKNEFVLACVVCLVEIVAASDSFSEELFVRPLSTGHVYFQFEFTTKWDADIRSPGTFEHYRLFPKSLGEVISAYSVQELHLSLTQGLWRHEKWGFPRHDAPPGAELWVWFQENTTDVDRTWTELNHALSGLFCATLNFMDSKSTTSPKWSFRPSGVATEKYASDSRFLRYSALPREIACTENLTPWKKLLPCDTKVGLSTLFNTVKLYDANYHSLGLHVRPVCADDACSRTGIELTQSLALVFDARRLVPGSVGVDWSFKKLFYRALTTQCPLASTSAVYVDLSTNQTGQEFNLSPKPNMMNELSVLGRRTPHAVYLVGLQTGSDQQFDLELTGVNQQGIGQNAPPPLYAQRYITGHGLEKGGVACHLYNQLPHDLTVVYLETLPWYMRMYYNTLSIDTNGTMSLKPSHVHYVPGKDRERLYTLEIVLVLRAYSRTTVRFQFDRAFLKWTEYPPDANHGFYVNSAVISANLPSQQASDSNESGVFLRVHTESLLLQLPTPDFSMPYNVICLACTVVAIAFGSLHNLTTRRFQKVDPKTKKGIVEKIKNAVKRIFGRNKPDDEKIVTKKSSKAMLETTDTDAADSVDNETTPQTAESDKKSQ